MEDCETLLLGINGENDQDDLRNSWIIKSLFIDESQYFKLFIRFLSKEDPISLMKFLDMIDTNQDYLMVIFSKPFSMKQIYQKVK